MCRSRMDELRMFLENEAWGLCPVKTTFKIVDLQVSLFWSSAEEKQNGCFLLS